MLNIMIILGLLACLMLPPDYTGVIVGTIMISLGVLYWIYSTVGAFHLMAWIGIEEHVAMVLSVFAPVAIPATIITILDNYYWAKEDKEF